MTTSCAGFIESSSGSAVSTIEDVDPFPTIGMPSIIDLSVRFSRVISKKLNGVRCRCRRYDHSFTNRTEEGTAAMTREELITDGWIHHQHEGFIELVGGLWERKQSETHQFGFLAESSHQNRNGVVHGGMLMTFADRTLGMTARRTSGATRSATIQLSVQFLVPMRIGDFASIEPQVLRLTKTIAFMSGAILVRGDAVASANGVWRLAREMTAERT